MRTYLKILITFLAFEAGTQTVTAQTKLELEHPYNKCCLNDIQINMDRLKNSMGDSVAQNEYLQSVLYVPLQSWFNMIREHCAIQAKENGKSIVSSPAIFTNQQLIAWWVADGKTAMSRGNVWNFGVKRNLVLEEREIVPAYNPQGSNLQGPRLLFSAEYDGLLYNLFAPDCSNPDYTKKAAYVVVPKPTPTPITPPVVQNTTTVVVKTVHDTVWIHDTVWLADNTPRPQPQYRPSVYPNYYPQQQPYMRQQIGFRLAYQNVGGQMQRVQQPVYRNVNVNNYSYSNTNNSINNSFNNYSNTNNYQRPQNGGFTQTHQYQPPPQQPTGSRGYSTNDGGGRNFGGNGGGSRGFSSNGSAPGRH